MIFDDKRLQELTKMFLETLRFIQENNNPEARPWEERQQYIANVIRSCFESHRESYIQSLLYQLHQADQRMAVALQALKREHQEELNKLKSLYEEEIVKISAKTKGIELEIKKHIQSKMQQLQKDYILRAIHQQQIKRIYSIKGCQGCFQIDRIVSELNRIQAQNEELRQDIRNIHRAEWSRQAEIATEAKNKFGSASRGSGCVKWLDKQHRNNEKNAATPPRKKMYKKRASNTCGFQKEDSVSLQRDFHYQLEQVRKNLKEKQYRIIKSNYEQQKQSAKFRRNQSKKNFKTEINQPSTEQNVQSSTDQQAIMKRVLSSDTVQSREKPSNFTIFTKQKTLLSQQRVLNGQQLGKLHRISPNRRQKESPYKFKYLNLKL